MLYPDGQCKMDSWVCLWIPKVNIVPTQKWGVSRGGARFLCVSPRAPRRGVHPKMDHPKVYLTVVHLWMGVTSIDITAVPAPASDTDPGEIGQNPAPPSFWLRNPLDVSRLGKSSGPGQTCFWRTTMSTKKQKRGKKTRSPFLETRFLHTKNNNAENKNKVPRDVF